MARVWVYSPHSGGSKVSPAVQERTRRRILLYAEKHYAGKYARIDARFRGQFCYMDAYLEPYAPEDFDEKGFGEAREEHIERLGNTPTHLCRLRYSGNEDAWPMAFFTYSNEKYEPCLFHDGSWTGTPEDAFEISALYLQD